MKSSRFFDNLKLTLLQKFKKFKSAGLTKGSAANDIGDEKLSLAIEQSESPEVLKSLVDISRTFFGWFTKHRPRAFEYPWIVKEIGDPNGKMILDIGAGVSPLPLILAEKGADMITVDYSPTVRRYGKQSVNWDEWGFLDYSNLNGNIRSFNQDILTVDIRDCSLDCTYSVSVIEHMPAATRKEIWKKISQWTKPGGSLLLTIDLVPGTEQIWNYSQGEKIEDESTHGAFEDLRKELENAGFLLTSKKILREIPESRVDIAMLRCVRKGQC